MTGPFLDGCNSWSAETRHDRLKAEMMEATGWQAHSVRGFIRGTLGKKMGLTVKSEKRDDGTRV